MPYRNGQVVGWKHKVKGLRELLNTDDTDTNVINVGKKVYKLLNNSLYKKWFVNFNDLDEFLFIDGLEAFNDLLDRLYDYCDENLIWVDFK